MAVIGQPQRRFRNGDSDWKHRKTGYRAGDQHPAPGVGTTLAEREADEIGARVTARPGHGQQSEYAASEAARSEFSQQGFADHVVRAEQKTNRKSKREKFRTRMHRVLQ
jgi:hypothetical protein